MGGTATIKLFGSMGDFLPPAARQPLKVPFDLHPSAKDLIESQGVPHTAIFKITINGTIQPLNYNLQDGDQISVFPFEKIDPAGVDPIFSEPDSFIADVHLGKLAKTLRLMGFDTLLDKNLGDKDLIKQSNEQRRMILTRDVELLKNGSTQYGYWVRSTNPNLQIEELFRRFSLADKIKPFTRCMRCNGILQQVELKEVDERIPPKVKKWHSVFFECKNCRQVYWRGSHYKKLEKKVEKLTQLSRLHPQFCAEREK